MLTPIQQNLRGSWEVLKSKGCYPQFETYDDYLAHPDRPKIKESKITEEQLRLIASQSAAARKPYKE